MPVSGPAPRPVCGRVSADGGGGVTGGACRISTSGGIAGASGWLGGATLVVVMTSIGGGVQRNVVEEVRSAGGLNEIGVTAFGAGQIGPTAPGRAGVLNQAALDATAGCSDALFARAAMWVAARSASRPTPWIIVDESA